TTIASTSSTTFGSTTSTTSSTIVASTSTSTSVSTTSTSQVSSTSSTSTSTSSTTSTTSGSGGPSGFDFTSPAGTRTCGSTFRDVAGTIPLKTIYCGNLSLGGGISQVPDNVTPAGATNRFTLSCAGSSCTVGTTASGSTPAGVDCTAAGCPFGT